jgi:hypothetical protein
MKIKIKLMNQVLILMMIPMMTKIKNMMITMKKMMKTRFLIKYNSTKNNYPIPTNKIQMIAIKAKNF